MKSIVICCDGTWNTPDDLDGGVPAPTNVVRLFNALSEAGEDGRPQHTYYHPGVGTDGSWWDKMVGGGTGRGLDRNILSAYRELCDHYEPGARIFLFGFSRGAYTVRSLAGFIARCGLLDIEGLAEAEAWSRIERVFGRGYRERGRKRHETRADWDKDGWAFHNAPTEPIPIRFLGVWDTVGALGIPDDLAFLNLIDNLHDYTFHDTRLSPTVISARHAVALDEMRASFRPTLWTAAPQSDARQVWFPGVHADVGGGYRECGLSDGALRWMIDEAASAGLTFEPAMLDQIKPNHLDVLHDSCQGIFAMLPTQPRSVPRMAAAAELHVSAVDRVRIPPITQCPYRREGKLSAELPASLEIFALQRWNETGLWLEAGVRYRFEASGEWMDSSIACGPAGTRDGDFQLAEVVQVAASALGQLENLFKRITGNQTADFRFTKRHEDMPWFGLVGAIANGRVDERCRPLPHESFLIGDGRSYTPKQSGYFYAYANDAWNCYGNNRGRVRLRISRS